MKSACLRQRIFGTKIGRKQTRTFLWLGTKISIFYTQCYPLAFFFVLLINRNFVVNTELCGGKTYSFAIFGGVVALSELQMCMALSVGIVQTNFLAVTRFLSAVKRFLSAVTRFLLEVARILMAVVKILSAVTRILLEVTRFLLAVKRILTAVKRFLSAVNIFLKVVCIFLLIVYLCLDGLEFNAFYLTKFWT